MSMTWKFDCDACDKREIIQQAEPQHFVYRGASLQVCRDCGKRITEEIKEDERIQREKAEAKKAAAKPRKKTATAKS